MGTLVVTDLETAHQPSHQFSHPGWNCCFLDRPTYAEHQWVRMWVGFGLGMDVVDDAKRDRRSKSGKKIAPELVVSCSKGTMDFGTPHLKPCMCRQSGPSITTVVGKRKKINERTQTGAQGELNLALAWPVQSAVALPDWLERIGRFQGT